MSGERPPDAGLAVGQRFVDALLRRLALEPLGADRFRGLPGRGVGRVFGGMLLAQGLVAAGRTVPDTDARALHAQFVRAGRYGLEIEWEVERLHDGRQLASRRVVARQAQRPIFAMMASFVRPRAGLAHQDPAPAAPPPEELPDWEELRAAVGGGPRRAEGPLELRECDPAAAVSAAGRPARRAFWIRPRGLLPQDSLLHTAVLAFASDRGLLGTAARPHGLAWEAVRGASLDHALWLHGPVRFDDWVLVTARSPIAVGGRALVLGAMHARTGARLASVAQEGLLRASR